MGFDSNANYVEMAEKRYGGRATFRCENISHGNIDQLGSFDIVLATGVLHHLDDDDAARLLRLARTALKKGGRLITLDACFIERQSRIARFLISRDRGQNVRTKEGYGRLVTSVFEQVKVDVRHDLLRVPYTHIILECSMNQGTWPS
jgi:SAM-dependent methyltransferase